MSKPKVKMLNIKEIMEKTGLPLSTATLYCRTKRFPNARKKQTPYGAFWQIPETDLDGFEKRAPGRPKADKSNNN